MAVGCTKHKVYRPFCVSWSRKHDRCPPDSHEEVGDSQHFIDKKYKEDKEEKR